MIVFTSTCSNSGRSRFYLQPLSIDLVKGSPHYSKSTSRNPTQFRKQVINGCEVGINKMCLYILEPA